MLSAQTAEQTVILRNENADHIVKRRSRQDIKAEILMITETKSRPTHIMYKANLSFAQLNEYLGLMVETGLITVSNIGSSRMYLRTGNGKDYLDNYVRMRMIEDPNLHPEDFHPSY